MTTLHQRWLSPAASLWGKNGDGRRFLGFSSHLNFLNLDRRLGQDATSTKFGVGSAAKPKLAGGFQCKALKLNMQTIRTNLSEDGETYGSELKGFAQRVASCNEGVERKDEFLPFLAETGPPLGYIHFQFAEHLKRFPEVFSFGGARQEGVHSGGGGNGEANGSATTAGGPVSLDPSLSTPEARTKAVESVLEVLKSEGLIPGWRNELQPVTPIYGASPHLLMERAAFPLFGAKSYGVHMNGYVNINGEKFLWVAKRSDTKPTWPGLLDHIVGGGLPEGISAKDNLVKECDEEAAIPAELAYQAVAVGAVSYEFVIENTIKRDVLFCYDLELPEEFMPHNKDGEVQNFFKLPISEVMSIVRDTDRYKPNCALVVIDFLFRHGYITPEMKGYMSLLQSLRNGEL